MSIATRSWAGRSRVQILVEARNYFLYKTFRPVLEPKQLPVRCTPWFLHGGKAVTSHLRLLAEVHGKGGNTLTFNLAKLKIGRIHLPLLLS